MKNKKSGILGKKSGWNLSKKLDNRRKVGRKKEARQAICVQLVKIVLYLLAQIHLAVIVQVILTVIMILG